METTLKTNKVLALIEDSGLPTVKSDDLKENFIKLHDMAEAMESKAMSIIVENEDDLKGMDEAKECRIKLRDLRINSNKLRIKLKAESLSYGQAVDGIHKIIADCVKPCEEHLLKQEKFAEEREKERIETRRRSRLEIVENEELGEFIAVGLDFGGMSDEDWLKTVNGAKLQLKQRVNAEAYAKKKAEEKIKADAEEWARIKKEKDEAQKKTIIAMQKLEDEKAKADAIKAEANEAARVEKAKADAILEAERKKKDEAEAKLKEAEEAAERARKEAEDKARLEAKKKAEAKRQEELAPEREKILQLAYKLETVDMPRVHHEDAVHIVAEAGRRLIELARYIKEASKDL